MKAVPSQLVNLFRILTWANYQGPVRPANSTFAAQTAMNFTVNPPSFQQGSGGFTLVDQVTVTVVFDPQRSWVRPEIAKRPLQQRNSYSIMSKGTTIFVHCLLGIVLSNLCHSKL
jgi:hypothetical protein